MYLPKSTPSGSWSASQAKTISASVMRGFPRSWWRISASSRIRTLKIAVAHSLGLKRSGGNNV
jgi:hypothetical protein